MNKNRFCITCLLYFLIYTPPIKGQTPQFATDELILMLPKQQTAEDLIRQLSPEYTLTHLRSLSASLNIHLFKLSNQPKESLEKICRKLSYKEGIQVAQTNHFITSQRSIELFPDDSLFVRQWNLHNTGQTGGTPDADIDAPEAWELSTGGTSSHNDTLVVAVIDEGFNLDHPDIPWRRNRGEIPQNGIDDDQNGYVDDYQGWNAVNHSGNLPIDIHGTHISGIISARGNNIRGVSGVNWNTYILPVLGFQQGSTLLKAESDVIAAYSYVYDLRKQYNESQGAKGAFIVATNTAFGVNSPPGDHPIWCALYDSLGSLGILNVVATPNTLTNIDEQPDVPSNCPSPYLIAVTSTGKNDQHSPRAYGPTHVDLGAPGDSILSTGLGQGYSLLTGTSMATPHVAGAISLMLSVCPPQLLALYKNNPSFYAEIFREILLSQVDTLASLKNITSSGGRLNLHQALTGVLAYSSLLPSCTQPYFIQAHPLSDSSITLSWKGEENAQYRIRYREAESTLWDSVESSGTEISLFTLQACSPYEVQIKRICLEDSSTYTEGVLINTLGCCDAPSPIHISQDQEGMAEIKWSSLFAADSFWVSIRSEETSFEDSLILTDTLWVIQDLPPCTTYRLRMATFCKGQLGEWADFPFRTLGCGLCLEGAYCELRGNTRSIGGIDTEWIDSIQIGGLLLGSGDNGGFGNFVDSLTLLLPIGDAIPIRLVPGFSQNAFLQSWRVWVDLNQNGEFDMPEEELFHTERGSASPIIDSMIVPEGIAPGETRMRVAMRYLDPPPLCGEFANGEVEEYCVTLDRLTPSNPHLKPTFSAYPNPAAKEIFIESRTPMTRIQLWTLQGQLVEEKKTDPTLFSKLPLNRLIPGTYFLRVLSTTSTGTSTGQMVFVKH